MIESQPTPTSASSRAFTKFLIGFAMVEGVVLSAIVLAMVFEVITVDQMIPLVFGVAIVGAAVLTWRVLSMNKQRRREAQGSAHFPQSGSETGADGSGLSDLGDNDPMAKYRDPNR